MIGFGEWLDALAALPEAERDAAVEDRLGLGPPPASSPPGEHLVGYHASGVDAIVRALREAPVGAGDVLVDLGAGLGKVVLLARLLTGATARGVELQPELVARAPPISTTARSSSSTCPSPAPRSPTSWSASTPSPGGARSSCARSASICTARRRG